ncbi:MAG: peptide chain release factor N(5)-glutamine methyltransferase [Planctomycetota bacterium]
MLRAGSRTLARNGVENPAGEARWLWACLSREAGVPPHAGPSRRPTGKQESLFREWIGRRARGEPAAYLTRVEEFYGLRLGTGPDVLVPRDDSEVLVEEALSFLPAHGGGRLLDLGTGSGCLLLAVLHHRPGVWGLGVDRSGGALAAARANALRLGLDGRARFVQASWLEALRGESFDLILCNPPYVEPGESLAFGVAEFEPAVALFTPPGRPYEAYEAILALAGEALRPRGRLILEVGAGRAKAVAEMGAAAGALEFLKVRRDLGGIERAVVLARKAAAPARS